MPVALISSKTSPALGPSRSTSTISSGFFASNATAARDFILNSPLRSATPQTLPSSATLAHSRLRSFDSCTAGFGGGGGGRLVFVVGRTAAGDGIVGARAQVHIDVVEVAHHVDVGGERRHHLVVGGVDMLAPVGDDVGEVRIAQRLQRIRQRRRIARALAIGAMTDMAVRMVAAEAGEGVPVDGAVRTDLVGRSAVLIEIFAVVG